jgi:transposase
VDRLIERVAGLDVHKASVKACVRVPAQRPGERHSQTRTFRTTTAGLVLLRDWLASHAVTVVGMESTGVLLEAGLLPAGRRIPVLAAECPAST